VAHAVRCEPVSTANFPTNTEKNREFCGIRLLRYDLKADEPINSEAYSKISYSAEQGIFTKEEVRTGNLIRK
jgi:Na+-transporting NADH:ubiquinone oxidoreductase subunit NqrF